MDKKVEDFPSKEEEMVHRAKQMIYKSMLSDIDSGLYFDQGANVEEVVKACKKSSLKKWKDRFTIWVRS